MVFSSVIFLLLFFPFVLTGYFVVPTRFKNWWLLLSSLLFYAWGEPKFVVVMLVSIVANYVVGLLMDGSEGRKRKVMLVLGIVFNLGILVWFKYANFLFENVHVVFDSFGWQIGAWSMLLLPIGISFYTFQSMSYVIDVYRKEVPVQRKLHLLALYIALFPQLIAGPIVRYTEIAKQLVNRVHSSENVVMGIRRFVYGLAKKVLIADQFGVVVDRIFEVGIGDFSTPIAWFGILAYTFQIYFDFSGYSDMAIGIGRMFGFRFPENFNYPYLSKSFREFWRRWHMTLSFWFRDYVYFPLGGSRVAEWRVVFNILLVFLLTGFWHGAGWAFIAWGLYHGMFIVAEHVFPAFFARIWGSVRLAGTFLAVMVGWVLFRSETFTYAFGYLQTMFWNISLGGHYNLAEFMGNKMMFLLLVSVVLAFRIHLLVWEKIKHRMKKGVVLGGLEVFIVVFLLFVSASAMAGGTFNPFIYFRF